MYRRLKHKGKEIIFPMVVVKYIQVCLRSSEIPSEAARPSDRFDCFENGPKLKIKYFIIKKTV